MAIDIRATVTCSLGTLISGSISDGYIQDSGLVKTRGSVEISALITPAIGTAVTFSYTKDGVTRSVPRKLRVMSSFADPFRRTTTVELGCKLTYLSDLKEPVDWSAFDDPENAAYNEDDARIVTLPIYASSVMNKCLTELGITASSNPLTNKFSIAEFDFSAGYVSVLNDLLVSESYCGYLDTNEVLQVFALDQDAGTGPVFTASDIVDLGPIGVGQLPGEAVTVSYSTLKLKEPDPTDTDPNSTDNRRRRWEYNITTTGPNFYQVGNRLFTGNETIETATTYARIAGSDVPIKRVTSETGQTAKIAGSIGSAYVDNGIPFNSTQEVLRVEEERTTYDKDGNRVSTEIATQEQALSVFGGVSLDYVFSPTDYVSFSKSLIFSSKIITTYDTADTYQQEITSRYLLWPLTIPGQQAVAEHRSKLTSSSDVSAYINGIVVSGLVHANTRASINVVGEIPSRPDSLTNAAYSKGGDPNNGWRTDSKADLELAVGSATAQRRIEFSMPYAPDDIFSGPSGGPFTATPSDAPAKANRYGRVQNRLLLGNRSGINLQLAPEKLPAAPYSPLYVQASGLTALYRANGTNWAFDSNGIVCSVDALFWAAVGGTGTFWFPVAPGITTLPAEPPIVDGAMNPSSVVLPYNETAIYDSRISLTTAITKFNYALELLTVVPASVIRARTIAERILKVEVSNTVAVSVAATAPQISSGASIAPPVTGIAVAAAAPVVSGGASVTTPATDISITLFAPVIEPITTAVLVPNADIAVAVIAPAISTGTSVTVPAADIATAALAPTGVGDVSDPNFSSVSLLLHLDGTNGGTTFTDSSSNNVSITRGGNAALSTTFVKYGTASVVWDGSGDFLRTPSSTLFTFGTGDFTIEFWSYFDASFNTGSAAILMNIGGTHEIMYVFDTLRYRTAGGTNLITGGALNKSQWYHIAFTKSGSNQRLFINGTQTGSTYVNATNYTADRVTFGAGNTGSSNYLGNMDDVRVTKGVARYTANFTAPTKAFPDQ